LSTFERREREKQQKRSHIIDAAERLFFKKGYTNTSMDEVAEEAEFSKGALYLYFKDKEDLYLAINYRGLLILKELFEKAFEKGLAGLDKARKIGEAYLLFSQNYPNYYRAMHYYESTKIDFKISETSARQCEEQGQQVMGIVAQAIQTGIDDGSIRKDLDPMNTAIVLWAHSTGIISIMSLRGEHLKEQHNLDLIGITKLSFDMMSKSLQS
jgi:AcrR family transcriptional regulator